VSLDGCVREIGVEPAIVVTSGEFTRAALEAAARSGKVQLIDGDELRAMLGPLPDGPTDAPPGATRTADTLAAQVGEHLLNAAIARAVPAGRKAAKSYAKATAATLLLKVFGFIAFVLIGYQVIQASFRNLGESLKDVGEPAVSVPQRPAPATGFVPARAAVSATPAISNFCIERDPRTGMTVDRCVEHAARPKPSLAEVRESQRKADAAMEVLRASTPEM